MGRPFYLGYTSRMGRGAILVVLYCCSSHVWAQSGSVRIRVTDLAKSVIPGADVSLLEANDQPIRTLSSNDSGESVWTGLPLGESRFRVSEPGFTSRMVAVTIHGAEEQNVEVRLAVDLGQAICILVVPQAATQDNGSQQPKPTKHHWWQTFH